MAKGKVDKENIIFAIEHCLLSDLTICEGCYQDGPGFMGITCKKNVIRDALALLKEQQETIELQGSLLTLAHAAMNQKRKKDKD